MPAALTRTNFCPPSSRENKCARRFRTPSRDRVIRESIEALREEGGSDLARLADRMERCCQYFVPSWPEGRPEEARPIPHRCWSPVCPCCAAARGARLAKRVETLFNEVRRAGRAPKLLTLTQLDKPNEAWRKARRRLQGAFGRLRRSKTWRAHVHSWMAVTETTWNGSAWHVHIHILLDAEFWPQEEIARAWFAATKDESYVVDIRAADKGSGRELGKYALKMAAVPRAQLVEYVRESKRSRLVSTGGEWYGKLTDRELEREDDPGRFMVHVPFPILEAHAANGDRVARLALAAIDRWLHARNSPVSPSAGPDPPPAARPN